MGQVVVGDFFKTTKPSAEFLNAAQGEVESLSEGIGSSYGVIRYRGKNWSLSYRGETKFFLRPEDNTPISYIDVIILRQAKAKSKSFYGVGAFDEDSSGGKRPICASTDGVRPDADVLQKQSEVCALCDHDRFKTGPNGKKGKACTDYKRLAVLLMPDQTKAMLGNPLMEPVFLRVPAASLQELGVYGDGMAQQGWPYYAVVTRISFDTTAHPKFLFKGVQVVGDEEARIVLDMRDDALAKRITGEGIMEQRTAVQIPPSGGNIGLLPTPVTPKPNPPTLNGGSYAASAHNPYNGPASNGVTAPVTGPPRVVDLAPSGGGVFGASPAPKPPTSLGQTAADTGEPISDPDMDAQIEALLRG